MNIKKFSVLFLMILLLFTLTGCGDKITENEDGTTVTKNEDEDKVVIDTISLITEATVTNETSDYEFVETSLQFYSLESDLGTDYVELEEFITLIQPAIMDLEFQYGDNLTLGSKIYANDMIYDMSITLDAQRNTVSFVNFNVLKYLAKMDYSNSSTDFILVGSEASVTETAVVIDLDDYDFGIAKTDGKYYMPLFLANLFFSGNVINVYSDNRDVYILEDFSQSIDVLSNELGSELDEEKMVKDSVNYFALLLDYFYGGNISYNQSYAVNMEKKGLYSSTSFERFGNSVVNYIYSLTDINTYFYDYGYNKTLISQDPVRRTSHFGEWLIASMDYKCDYRNDPIILEENTDFYVLTVNKFDSNTKASLEEVLINIDESKPIYIDLSCNMFGSIDGIYSLLAYMTNDAFEINYINSQTKEEVSLQIDPTTDLKLDNMFYVYTSEVTQGTGNNFASIVKENHLGLVVGQTTEGGSAVSAFTVLPNNMIIQYSSTMVFTDSNYSEIDNGVRPNSIFNCDEGISGMIDDFNDLIKSELNYTLNDINSSSEINLHLKTNEVSDDIEFISYKVRLYEISLTTETSTEIVTNAFLTPRKYSGYDYEYTVVTTVTEDFENVYTATIVHTINEVALIEEIVTTDDHFTIDFDVSNIDTVKVVVSATVVYKDYTIERNVESYIVDDLSNELDINQVPAETNVIVDANRYGVDDVDFLKLLITEPSDVKLLLNGIQSVLTKIYNTNGTKAEEGASWVLEPGTYYIELYMDQVGIGDYTYELIMTEVVVD